MELTTHSRYGVLAKEFGRMRLPLQVLQSNGGFYIGTAADYGPVSRESFEYFPTRLIAESALQNGDWTQRDTP